MRFSLRHIKPSKHQVLLLDPKGLKVYGLNQGLLDELGRFAANEDGHEQFRRFLAELQPRGLCLVVDIMAEDYLIESMAHVSANDRQQLLKRKLDQHFRGGEYRHAVVIGRETGGRRDDRVLFSALSKNQLIDPWVRCILQEEVPLQAVTSTAYVLGNLMKSLGLVTSDGVLVVNWEPHGIRQTFMQGGNTVFSRLSPLPPEDGQDELVRYIVSISTQTREYLERIKLLGFNQPLDVHVFTPQTDSKAFEAFSGENQLTQFLHHVPEGFSEGGRRWDDDELITANLLCIDWAIHKQALVNVYAPPVARRFYYLKRARQVIYGTCLGVLALGGLLAGPIISEALDHRQRYEQLQAQTQPLEAQYAALLEGFPATPIPSLAMELAVTTYDQLRSQVRNPADLLISVSRVLSGYPTITLTDLDWMLLPENVDFSITEGLLAGDTGISMEMRGQIAAGTGYLNTDRDLRRFISELESIPGVTVTPVTLPIETSEYSSVSATIGDTQGSAPFALNLQQRRAP
ncbi:MAG: hypothetical protein RLZZ385_40 [Pseudomonadota bacterium]|jgi:hypothetical protein